MPVNRTMAVSSETDTATSTRLSTSDPTESPWAAPPTSEPNEPRCRVCHARDGSHFFTSDDA